MRLVVILSVYVLGALAGGVALVTIFSGVRASASSVEACLLKDVVEREACIAEVVKEHSTNGEISKAFRVMAEGYRKDAAFAKNCHGSAHEIGKDAYRYFSEHGDVELSALTSYCGYGFYHGFMELMLLEGGKPTDARTFCAYAGERLRAETTDAEGACFHGIGHGSVDGTDPRLWGDPRAMVEVGLELCRGVTEGMLDVPPGRGPAYRCSTGAYNALEILSDDPKHKLESLVADPIGFCDGEDATVREGCYTNVAVVILLKQSPNQFRSIIEKIDAIKPVEGVDVRAGLVADLMHEYVRANVAEVDLGAKRGIALCRELPPHLTPGCLEGLTKGHFKYGEPGREYVKFLEFCARPEFSDTEREKCYNDGQGNLRALYSEEKTVAVCREVPLPYRAGPCASIQ